MKSLFGCEFPSLAAVEAEVHSAAKAAGYRLVVQTKKPNAAAPRRVVFHYCKGRKFASQSSLGTYVTKKRKTSTQMTDYPFRLAIRLQRGGGTTGGGDSWVVECVNRDNGSAYNHPPAEAAAFSRHNLRNLLNRHREE